MTRPPAAATNTAGTRPRDAGLSWRDRPRRGEVKERQGSDSPALLEHVFSTKQSST